MKVAGVTTTRVGVTGFTTTHVGVTGSTNTDLLAEVRAAAEAGATSFVPALRVADAQTAGRGRHGRAWCSAPGASLLCSWAWPFDAGCDLSGLSLAVGVALADAFDPAGTRLGLKWPNDLLLRDPAVALGRKLAGVLIETAPIGTWRVAVIGIGLNVRAIEVEGASSGVAALDELVAGATPAGALAMLAGPLRAALQRFERSGFAVFADRFEARDLLRSRAVHGGPGGGTAGMAAGVSASGELLVRTASGMVPMRSGEIRLGIGIGPDVEAVAASATAGPGDQGDQGGHGDGGVGARAAASC